MAAVVVMVQAAAMVVCSSCGTKNEDDARFCKACAAALGGPRVGAEQRKLVTAVFCDIVGSTALGESRDPEAVRALLARYFERMRSIVVAHGGTVQKFIGDAVVAIFGVPVVHEDDALRALRAALEMCAALPEMGLEARFGVNTGEIVTSADDTLVTGDAINVAARLQQAAEPGEILVGAETYALAGAAVAVDELEPMALKGKAEPVPAFRLLSVGESSERPQSSRFVGRGAELALLRVTWDRAAAEERCELFTVIGEPGVGKSRLVEEFLAELGVRVVRGHCRPYGEGITYLPVVEAIKQLDLSSAEPGVAAAFAPLLGDSGGATSAEEIAWALRMLLFASAPLVVWFDDVQWGEETFLDLVEQVALLSSGAPLLLVCTARPELTDQRPQWPVALRLEPLSRPQVDELLPDGVSAELRERIAHASGGNPLFVTEMIAVAAGSGDDVTVPPTLRALLAARLDQLERTERAVLERGSVEGELFHRGSVAALSPGEGGVTSRLAALVRRELIRPDRASLPAEDGFRFCHLLLRDTAYEALPKASRAELHERFAVWLEGYSEEVLERDELVGYHLEQSYRYRTELDRDDEATRQLGERAARRLLSASRRADAWGDHRAFANLLERALLLGISDPRERVRLQFELAMTLAQIWRRGESESMLENVIAEAEVVGERGVAAAARVYQAEKLNRMAGFDAREKEALCRDAIEVLVDADYPRGLILTRNALAIALARQGRTVEATEEMERALGDALAAGEGVRNLMSTVSINLSLGPTPIPDAIERCQELLTLVRGDRVAEAKVRRALGLLEAMGGRSERAMALIDESSIVLDELNQADIELFRAEAGNARELCGDLRGAERELEVMRDRLADGDLRALRPTTELARIYCDTGRYDEAAGLLAAAVDGRSFEDSRGTGARRLAVDARIAAYHGSHDEALAIARKAIERADGRPDDLNLRAGVWAAYAEVLRAAGLRNEGDEALEIAVGLYEQKGNVAAVERLR